MKDTLSPESHKERSEARETLQTLLRVRLISQALLGNFGNAGKRETFCISNKAIFNYILSNPSLDNFEKRMDYMRKELLPGIFKYGSSQLKIKLDQNPFGTDSDDMDSVEDFDFNGDVFDDLSLLNTFFVIKTYEISTIIRFAQNNDLVSLKKFFLTNRIKSDIVGLHQYIGEFLPLLNKSERKALDEFIKNNTK